MKWNENRLKNKNDENIFFTSTRYEKLSWHADKEGQNKRTKPT